MKISLLLELISLQQREDHKELWTFHQLESFCLQQKEGQSEQDLGNQVHKHSIERWPAMS